MAPLPSPVVITGACKNSARAVNSPEASADMTPPPAQNNGFLADAIKSAPFSANSSFLNIPVATPTVRVPTAFPELISQGVSPITIVLDASLSQLCNAS